MVVIPIFTRNQETRNALITTFPDPDGYDLHFFDSVADFKDYLVYETPEIYIADFSEFVASELDEFLDTVYSEKWLNCSGMVLVFDKKEELIADQLKSINLIGIIRTLEIKSKLPQVLKIIENNKHMLFQREFQGSFTGEIQGQLLIGQNLTEIQISTNLLSNFLYNVGGLSSENRFKLRIVLQELIINAVEHGNLGINFDDKTEYTEQGFFGQEVIEERLKQYPELTGKKVEVIYHVNSERTVIKVSDEGPGFDWKDYLKKMDELTANNELLHGRGILLAKSLCEEVTYEGKGNVAVVKLNHNFERDIIPGFFESDSRTEFKKGTKVFEAGEETNYLYFISSGRFEVLGPSGKKVTELEPNDIFIGEMSFLISNKRTATVYAAENSIVYRVSKKNFVSAMKRYPYYSFFLSKILARRLQKMTQKR